MMWLGALLLFAFVPTGRGAVVNFYYDPAGRLTGANDGARSTAYTFDNPLMKI